MSTRSPTVGYVEHRLPRDARTVYAREYAGEGPAFVYDARISRQPSHLDALASLLADAGRRTVIFDFLGYGGSDKPASYPYSLDALERDLQAVVDGLGLGTIVPVAHDASGPAAINWALRHVEQTAALVLLNTYTDGSDSGGPLAGRSALQPPTPSGGHLLGSSTRTADGDSVFSTAYPEPP